MSAPAPAVADRRRLAVWRAPSVFETTFAERLAAHWSGLVLSELPAARRRPESARAGGRWPYPAETFGVAYLMHVLEHHTPSELGQAAAEAFRVLKPGGILRISTPDLACEARLYLSWLDRARESGDPLDRAALDLARLRLIDQCVRSRPGGDLAAAIRRGGQREDDIVAIFGRALDALRSPQAWIKPPGWRRSRLADLPCGAWRKLLSVVGRGHPVVTGELDRVKPDFYLLRDVLAGAGFSSVERCAAGTSSIPDWARWDFDRSADGAELEPGLYLEATRP